MSSDMLEARMARLEGAFEQIDRRLTSFEQRVEGRFARLEGAVEANRAHSDRQFFWTTSLIVVSILLPLVTRLVAHA